jgi:hypothetical protein
MTCPACGARNSERAEWCTQCYAALGRGDVGDEPVAEARTEAPTPAPDDPDGAVAVPDPDGAVAVPDRAGAPSVGQDRDVRVDDDRVEWRCGVCGRWTSLFEPVCQGCGGPRAGFAPPDGPATRGPRAGPTASLVAGVLLPGIGHLLQGVTGLGVALVLLWVLWGGGALASQGGTTSLTVVLALAASTLWAGSVLDLRQRLLGASPLLTGRLLAWSTVGVTALLVFVAIGSGLAAGR